MATRQKSVKAPARVEVKESKADSKLKGAADIQPAKGKLGVMRVLGSAWTILLLGAIGSAAFGGLGLLTASRAQKIESISGLINLVMMPMWIFSGVFFSYERFPAIVHPFIKALPLTALNDALRATILEGATLGSQSGRLLVLVLWGGLSFLLAVRWFRWT